MLSQPHQMKSRLQNTTPEQFFKITATLFGILYLFLVPPFQVPDEANHFYRAYHIVDGNLMGEKTNDQRFGGELPENLVTLYQPFKDLRYNYDARIGWDAYETASKIPLRKGRTTFVDFANVAYYSPTAYLFQVPDLWLYQFINVKPLFLFYLTRLASFFYWAFVIYHAIRLMPFHKWTFCFLALLPSSLFLHAGITADSITNASCFYLIALLTRLIFDDKTAITFQHLFIILALGLLITLNKVVYFPIAFLFLLIPRVKFASVLQYYNLSFTLVGSILLTLGTWFLITKDLFIPYEHYHPDFRDTQQLNEGVDPMAQLQFILTNPLDFIGIWFRSFFEYLPSNLAHYIGKFGWEANYLPGILIGLTGLGLIIHTILEPNKYVFNLKNRLAFLFSGMLCFILFSVVIYMQWSPPGNEVILSFGGRYMIPIFPLFFLGIGGIFRKWKSEHIYLMVRIGMMGLIWIGLISGVFCVINRYWV